MTPNHAMDPGAEGMRPNQSAAQPAEVLAGLTDEQFDALPVAYLHSVTHPDWLEVCDRGQPGAFPVYARAALAAPQAEPLTDEAQELRIILSRVTSALGTGAFASSACSLEFLRHIPDEVKSTVDGLRARLASTAPPAPQEPQAWTTQAHVHALTHGKAGYFSKTPDTVWCVPVFFGPARSIDDHRD